MKRFVQRTDELSAEYGLGGGLFRIVKNLGWFLPTPPMGSAHCAERVATMATQDFLRSMDSAAKRFMGGPEKSPTQSVLRRH